MTLRSCFVAMLLTGLLTGCGPPETAAPAVVEVDPMAPIVVPSLGIPVVPFDDDSPFLIDSEVVQIALQEPTEEEFAATAAIVRRVLEQMPASLAQGVGRFVVAGELTWDGISLPGIAMTDSIAFVNAAYLEDEGEIVDSVAFSIGNAFSIQQGGVWVDHPRWFEITSPEEDRFVWDPDVNFAAYDRQPSDAWLEQGYYNEYTYHTPSFDLASFGGMLLIGNEALWDAYDRYESIRQKVDLAIEFMTNYESTISRATFEQTRENPIR